MFTRYRIPTLFLQVTILLLTFGCSKSSFLDAKPSTNLVVPSTTSDLQALLDNTFVMQQTPALGELGCDDYYISDYSEYQALSDNEQKNSYVWAQDIFAGEGNIRDWNIPYQQVFYANVVLDALSKISVTPANITQINTLKGSALFFRGYALYNLSQVFAAPYDSTKASSEQGLPLPIVPDVNAKSVRADLQSTYERIIDDITQASILLPPQIPFQNRNRPSRPAALALLSRIYLSMRSYDKANHYADSCLGIYNKLIDFNTVSLTASLPFTNLNDETIFQSALVIQTDILTYLSFLPGFSVDSNLYHSYDPNDLRSIIYFYPNSGSINVNGSYYGTFACFSGLATDEVYLIRAECEARNGQVAESMQDLNTLLSHRWVTGTFVPDSASSAPQALNLVLLERRKELLVRGLRWSDLRRLNLEGNNISQMRILNGQNYSLPPNDPRYVYPIPPDVISLSGMKQNAR